MTIDGRKKKAGIPIIKKKAMPFLQAISAMASLSLAAMSAFVWRGSKLLHGDWNRLPWLGGSPRHCPAELAPPQPQRREEHFPAARPSRPQRQECRAVSSHG